MRANYLTLKSHGIGEIIISKSRFIANCARVETEEQAQAFIETIKKEHRSATHNCSAYLIGEHDQIQKANDDGEPSGTAGVPILEVLKKQHLKDTVVVVTRYFGGIKLGAGGLVRAYGKATTVGIDASGVVERKLHHELKVIADYTLLGKLENELRNSTYILDHIDYAENVELTVLVPKEQDELFQSWMTDLSNGQTQIDYVKSIFLEFDRT